MKIISGIVGVNGTVIYGNGFSVQVDWTDSKWTKYKLSLFGGEMIGDYSVVCQQGPMSGGGPLTTTLRGVNFLEVFTWTQGVNPVIPAFNFIAVKMNG